MKAILLTIGTDGDVLPYLALARALRDRGHDTTLAASENYRLLAERNELGFLSLLSAEKNNELFENPDFWHPIKTAALSARWGLPLVRPHYELISRRADRETVLVASPAIIGATLVHEKFRVPLVNLVLQPWMLPSSVSPPVMPWLGCLSSAPPAVWKLFWRGLDFVGDTLVGRELNRFRAELGLPPVRRLFQHWLSPERVIGMFPAWYGPPPPDWPPQLRLTDFPMSDGGVTAPLDPELIRFCAGGEPPVAFTFGTGMAHSRGLFQAAIDACEQLGTRGIMLTKYRDQLPEPLPSFARHSIFAPFQELFPRCAAVLHHGGIGTTARALAAGVPQLIRPISFDQFDNGARVQRLGAGRSLPGRAATGRRMADALTLLLNEETRRRCREIAKRFAGNKALESAAILVEETARERGSGFAIGGSDGPP